MAALECGIEELRRRYLVSVLAGESRAAHGLVEAAAGAGTPVEDLYLDVLQPVLHEVGARWERGEISVAREHLATAITGAVLATLATELPGSGAARGRALVCCSPGERHALGGRMVADFLTADGWDATHCAEPVAIEQLVGMVRAAAPDLVALSTSLAGHLAAARAACVAVKSVAQPPRVVVGGRAYAGDARAAEHVGADGFATDPRDLLVRLADASAG